MLSEKKYSQSFLKKSPLDTYKGIGDLTMDIWREIHQTGDVSLLLKTKSKLTKKTVKYCSDLWDDIRQQHLDTFGMPEEYKDYLKKVADLAILKLQLATTNNRIYLTQIMIAKVELEAITNQSTQSNIKTDQIIEISLGIPPMKLNETSVERYYNYIELIKEKAAHVKSN